MSRMDRQISAHNAEMQCLRCRGSYRLSDFLRGASGNLMITGGEKERRRQVLRRQIALYRSTARASVVIFSDDADLRADLIADAESGGIGQLYVVNGEYRNYDFFYQMPLNLIAEFFARASLLRGNRDTSKLLTFTDAFLRIMAEDGTVNLTVMRDRIRYDNTVIRDATAQAELRDMVAGASDGASLFRDLMVSSADAFARLTTPECASGFNLSSTLEEDCVILIEIPTTYHDLYAEYFALALRSVMNKAFRLVLDDEIMLNNQNFFEAVELLKQRHNVEVVQSYDNILAMQPADKDILKNINRQAIFLNGQMPQTDLQAVLSRYGQFTALEAVEHREVPPSYLFTLLRGKGEAPVVAQRDRAMLQMLTEEVVLSRGSNAEILAVRRLVI